MRLWITLIMPILAAGNIWIYVQDHFKHPYNLGVGVGLTLETIVLAIFQK